jgi:hypothetical protein
LVYCRQYNFRRLRLLRYDGLYLGIKIMSKVIMSYLFNCPCNWAISITTLIQWGMQYYTPIG